MTQPTLFDAPQTVYAAHRAEERQERRRRDTSKARILRRLQLGRASSRDLAAVALKYTNRISDLRADGWIIDADRQSGGWWLYTLRQEARR